MTHVQNRYFVRGTSRSGGSLMVTILDAHPDVAMGYELYEHLLEPEQEHGIHCIQDLIVQVDALASARGCWGGKAQTKVTPKTTKLAARARRGGVTEAVLSSLLHDFASQHGDICTVQDRLQIIELLVKEKMLNEKKISWGSKIAKRYDETIELWPNSFFMFMMRDGRDIVASRINSGNFNQSVEHVARGYVTQVNQFKKLASKHETRAIFINYEDLVSKPRESLEQLCDSLELQWSENVLSHQTENLTIFKDPTGHLSADQLKQPINSKSIGRWKKELNRDDVSAFEIIAGETLEEFGYLNSNN